MNIAKKIGIALLIVAAFFGHRFYQKNQVRKEARAQLLGLCGRDAGCQAAVARHFDACFEESFDLGSRRRGASLSGEKLVACINQKSGRAWFATKAPGD